MVLICSRITRCEVLFILSLGIFNLVIGQFPPHFVTREIGQSHNFTCPGDVNKNYTYTFTKNGVSIKPDARIKQDGRVLMIASLTFLDAGEYACSFYDDNGKKIGHLLGIFFITQATTYTFEIFPKEQTSIVTEGESFKFRCEYSKGDTKMNWSYKNLVNEVEGYLPRNRINVLTNSKESIEEYFIESVGTNDTGTYRCELQERGIKRTSGARVLQVKKRKAPVFTDMPSVFVVNRNDRITIHLNVMDGVPSANYSCYHENHLLISCSGKEIDKIDLSTDHLKPACSQDNYDITGIHGFVIKDATYTRNDGMYKCEARNIIGTDSVYFRVNVTVAPMISTRISQFFAEQSTEGRVDCVINLSNPIPKVTWSRQVLKSPEDNPVEGLWTAVSGSHTSTLFPTDKGRYESNLTVPYNQEQSFYRCFAENVHGNDSRVFRFIRYGKGKKLFSVAPTSAVINEKKLFIAKCRVLNVIRGNIGFYRVDTLTQVNNNRTNITMTKDKDFYNITMVIRNLTLNDSGTYRCSEKDVLTNDYADVTLTVKALRRPVILDLQNQTVNQHTSKEAVLFCNVTGNPYPNVTWLRNGIPTGATLVRESCVGQKYGYYYKNKEHTKLVICDTTYLNTGFYTCAVENSVGKDSKDVFLNVTSWPMFESQSLETKQLNAGERFTKSCKVDGNPTPWVQWILKNENRTMTNKSKKESTMEIHKMDKSYEGNYTCIAWNSLKTEERHLLRLLEVIVALRRPLILDLQNQTVNQHKSKEAVLFCNVTGNPYPKVTWLRNGDPTGATLVRESCVGQKYGYYYKNKEHTKLVICDTTYLNTGFYTCAVENSVGRDSKDVFLNVTSWPMFESQSLETKQLNAGERFTKSCKVDGNPTPWVQWILENENRTMTNKSKKESTLEILEMDKSYEGNYTCIAWNSLKTEERHLLRLLEVVVEENSGPSSGGVATGTFVGIIVGVFILVIIFILLSLQYRRRQRKLRFHNQKYFLRKNSGHTKKTGSDSDSDLDL